VRDTYNITTRRTDVKFGGEIHYMPYLQENTGNPLGTFTFSRDQPFNPADPASVAALTGATTFAASLADPHAAHDEERGCLRAGRLEAAAESDAESRPPLGAAVWLL
jgi:hypothetical protein